MKTAIQLVLHLKRNRAASWLYLVVVSQRYWTAWYEGGCTLHHLVGLSSYYPIVLSWIRPGQGTRILPFLVSTLFDNTPRFSINTLFGVVLIGLVSQPKQTKAVLKLQDLRWRIDIGRVKWDGKFITISSCIMMYDLCVTTGSYNHRQDTLQF